MEFGAVIAIPERQLSRVNLAGIKTTRLTVGGTVCIGIPSVNFDEVCEMLEIEASNVTKQRTNYQGIYFANVNRNGNTNRPASGKRKKEPIEATKKKYMLLCGYNSKKEQVRKLKESRAKLNSGIEKCQEQLVRLLRELEKTQQQLGVVEGPDEASFSRFGDEFNGLMKHPDIVKIEINGKKILVYTQPIVINYQRVKYDIGRFKIAINTLGKEGGVKMLNLTRTIDEGHHHPHVNSGGEPCLGNIKEVIPHLIAEHKYAAVASVCIQYLKSYERSDDYRPFTEIQNWPLAKNERST